MTGNARKRMLGVVETGNDPKMLGRIKCSIPGVYESCAGNYEYLPWVYPKTKMSGQMQRGQKVWVYMDENPDEDWASTDVTFQQAKLIPEVAFYEPMYENMDVQQQFLSDNIQNEPEIMMWHQNGDVVSAQVFDEKNGFVNKAGSTSMQLSPNGSFGFKSDNNQIIANGNIVIGSNTNGSKLHPSVLGDKLLSIMTKLEDVTHRIAAECSAIGRISIASALEELSLEIINTKNEMITKDVVISTNEESTEQNNTEN